MKLSWIVDKMKNRNNTKWRTKWRHTKEGERLLQIDMTSSVKEQCEMVCLVQEDNISLMLSLKYM